MPKLSTMGLFCNIISCLYFSLQEWKEKVLSNEDKFQTLKTHKIVLDRKIGEVKEENIVSSVMGTFKKLDV